MRADFALPGSGGGAMSGAEIAAALAGQTITGAVTVNGNLTVGSAGRLLLPDGTAGAPALAFTNYPTTGLRTLTGAVGLVTGGSDRLRVNATTEMIGVMRFNSNSYLELFNMAADPAAPSQGARIYAILDTGKAEFRARFPTGAAPYAQLAQEP